MIKNCKNYDKNKNKNKKTSIEQQKKRMLRWFMVRGLGTYTLIQTPDGPYISLFKMGISEFFDLMDKRQRVIFKISVFNLLKFTGDIFDYEIKKYVVDNSKIYQPIFLIPNYISRLFSRQDNNLKYELFIKIFGNQNLKLFCMNNFAMNEDIKKIIKNMFLESFGFGR